MWNGQSSHHHHHHHDPQSGYPPSVGADSSYAMPAPGMPAPTVQSQGYNPGYSPAYGPPQEPPGGFGPPSGPPPTSGYPGQYHHQHHHHPVEYAPPPGPPPSIPPNRPSGQYMPPSGPPPSSQYMSPPGPPPSNQYGAPGNYRAYAPPAGPPPRPPTNHQSYGPVFEGQNHQQQQLHFQYSQCTGRRKGLCIGINYIGQSAELQGCINDAHNVRRFLCNDFGYNQDDIVMLTDDSNNPRSIPTKANMIEAMQWLVRGAQPNDSLFFHYSGHGGQTKDLDGDEEDGYDEVIYPVDFQHNGHIVDDLLHDILVKPLPAGCRLTAIFDSCHSGSALDLPYLYNHVGKIKEPNLAAEAAQGLLSAAMSYARGDLSGVFTSVSGLVKGVTGNRQATNITMQTKTSPADAISFSGCKDSQTSADTVEAGQATGAMSYAFIASLRQNKNQSYQQLLLSVREILARKYSQIPQLSSSHPMDTNLLFIC
ncbi:caspase domain-containing protein [Sparassis latifolia]